MLRLLALPALLLAATLAIAEQPSLKPAEVAKLIEQLGSEDFSEREGAAKRLEELGPAIIDELRAALKSDNAETVRRVQELLRKAERKALNEKATEPTLVELNAKDQPLDTILAELSKQAKCEVVLGGVGLEELAGKKITVKTDGKVPFWNAVLKVCEAADLQIAGAGGFYAPGSIPYLRRHFGVRFASDVNRSVVLEARGDNPKRPASVHGAILVEAVAFVKNAMPDRPSVLIQAWPEPRLQWEATTGAKSLRATDSAGAKLTAEYASTEVDPARAKKTGTGTVLIRNADGSVTFVEDTGAAFQLANRFHPNIRQALICVKSGEQSPNKLKELELSLFATVRSPIEPLSRAADLQANRPASGVGNAGVDLSVTYSRDPNDRLVASVEVTYDPKVVHPAGVGDELPGAKAGAGGATGNFTVYGVRVTDAEGKPYILGLASGASQFDLTGKRVVLKLQLELHPNKDGVGPPAVVTLWGTRARTVEVPVTLKDVLLTGGK